MTNLDAARQDPPASAIARPDLACAHLAALVANEATRQGRLRWTATAWPDERGCIEFYFVLGGRYRFGLRWMNQSQLDLPGVPGYFSYFQIERPGAEKPLERALTKVLSAVVQRSNLGCLSPVAVPQAPIDMSHWRQTFSEAWLPLRRAGWFSYVLSGYDFADGHLRLTFEAPERSVVLEVRRANARDQDDAMLPPEVYFWKGAHLGARLLEDTRSDRERTILEHQVERLLSFALLRFEPCLVETYPSRRARSGHAIIRRVTEGSTYSCGDSVFREEAAWWNVMWERNLTIDMFISAVQPGDGARFAGLWHPSCIYSSLHLAAFGPAITPFRNSYPWEKRLMDGSTPFPSSLAMTGPLNVSGDAGSESFNDLLAERRPADPDEGIVLVTESCVPKLLGLSLTRSSKLTELSAATSGVHLNPEKAWPDDNYTLPLRAYRILMERRRPTPRDPRPSVNLLGFPDRRDFNELADALTSLGARVNARILPQYPVKDAPTFEAAWAQVWMPNTNFEPIYEQVFKPLDVPVVETVAPGGFQATLSWMDSVFAALGLSDRFGEWRYRQEGRLAEERDVIRRRAKTVTVGFIADANLISRLWDTRRNHGFGHLQFLREFGFNVAVYYHNDPSGSHPRADEVEMILPELLAPLGLSGDDLTLHPFQDPAGYSGLLRDGPAQVFFSDRATNPTLEKAGRAVYSLTELERGLAGALRTANRILDRVNSPYWTRFAARCGQVSAGGFQGAEDA